MRAVHSCPEIGSAEVFLQPLDQSCESAAVYSVSAKIFRIQPQLGGPQRRDGIFLGKEPRADLIVALPLAYQEHVRPRLIKGNIAESDFAHRPRHQRSLI